MLNRIDHISNMAVLDSSSALVEMRSSAHRFDLLQGKEHYNIPRSNSHEVCGEAFVEGERTFRLEHITNHTERALTRRAVHKSCLDDI